MLGLHYVLQNYRDLVLAGLVPVLVRGSFAKATRDPFDRFHRHRANVLVTA